MGGSPRAVFPQICAHKAIHRLKLKFIGPAALKPEDFIVVQRHGNTGGIALLDR